MVRAVWGALRGIGARKLALAVSVSASAAGITATNTIAEANNQMQQRAASWLKNHQDQHKWLEQVLGEEALTWVKAQNKHSVDFLGDPKDTPLYERVYQTLTSKDKIPFLRKIGDQYYNFWTDDTNKRGVWRRTTLESYRTGKPDWETVLSIDDLNKEEGESWVYKGHVLLDEGGEEKPTRTLMCLSRAGADATVTREFDLVKKQFIEPSDGGFYLPEAKSRVDWLSRDEILVGTDFGPDSLTSSGYPRTVRRWKRGTPLAEAILVYEGETTDVSVGGYLTRHQGREYEWRYRSPTFYTSKKALRAHDPTGKEEHEWIDLDGIIPDDAHVSVFGRQILVELRTEWRGFPAGSLLATPIHALASGVELPLVSLFRPEDRTSLEGYTITSSKLILKCLSNVRVKLLSYSCSAEDDLWRRDYSTEPDAEIGGVSVSAVDSDRSDEVWLTRWGYLEPYTLSMADIATGIGGLASATRLRSLPSQFDAQNLEVSQGFATSKDGTEVPYFLVRRRDCKEVSPTLLYGYGGFEISLTPNYLSTLGSWLESGGAYVEANIRGGGEFGPTWHQQALKSKRNKAYEDFEAVAEKLIETGVTTSERLACRGGSNGGLLVGNMFTRRPDLWGAVVCAVPLLDMKRFSKLLAGASWMAEYGDPDSSDWDDFLHRYSPYHQIDPDVKYPPMLMTTSTRDDRVHPYHARAFVHRLQDVGKSGNTFYYENIEGGHGGAADPEQSAFMICLYQNFLKKTIGKGFFPDSQSK